MRNALKTLIGLAIAASLSLAPGVGASECAGGECKPASETKQGTTSNVNGGTQQKVETVTQYKDVVKYNDVTKYKDVTKTKYVDVITKRVHTTYIQPIKKVTIVTYIQPVTRKKTVTTETTMHVVKKYETTMGAPKGAATKAKTSDKH